MYCSIEEAWGSNFSNNSSSNQIEENFDDFKQKKKPRKKKDHSRNIYTENMQSEINSVNPTQEEYQAYMMQQRNKKDPPFVIDDEQEYSRGTNYIEGDPNDKYSFARGLSRLPNHNGPEAREITQETYEKDNYEEEEIIPQENIRQKQLFQEAETRSKNIYQTDHNLSFLIEKINTLIDKFDHRGENNNMNIVLFVLTGIFIIFVLDSVFKFGKYLKE